MWEIHCETNAVLHFNRNLLKAFFYVVHMVPGWYFVDLIVLDSLVFAIFSPKAAAAAAADVELKRGLLK